MHELLPHPEFPATVSTEIAEALVRRFRADAALLGWARMIDTVELEELLQSRELATPSVIVVLDGSERRSQGSGGLQMLRTLSRTLLILPPPGQGSVQGHLRTRVADHITLLHEADDGHGPGVLLDLDAEPLTLALDVVQRVPRAVRMTALGDLIATRIDAVWQSRIRRTTGALYDG